MIDDGTIAAAALVCGLWAIWYMGRIVWEFFRSEDDA